MASHFFAGLYKGPIRFLFMGPKIPGGAPDHIDILNFKICKSFPLGDHDQRPLVRDPPTIDFRLLFIPHWGNSLVTVAGR